MNSSSKNELQYRLFRNCCPTLKMLWLAFDIWTPNLPYWNIDNTMTEIKEWADVHMSGRWTFEAAYRNGKPMITFYFKDPRDVTIFSLAWLERLVSPAAR